MISHIFTVYDCKSETYLNPFLMRNKGEAIRAFVTTLNDPGSSFCMYPADYTLFLIGEYDDLNAKIVTYETKTPLGNGIELKHLGKTTNKEIPCNP